MGDALELAMCRLLTETASLVVEHRLQGAWTSVVAARRFSSYITWAQLFLCLWDPPDPGIEPMSPALAGGLLATAPPGKSRVFFFLFFFFNIYLLIFGCAGALLLHAGFF